MQSDFLGLAPKLPTPAEMALWDKAAIAFGISEIMLMENAGRQLADFLREKSGTLAGAHICLFMGGGNNGGDAACMARHIMDMGGLALVFHCAPLEGMGEASAWHINLAQKNGVVFMRLPADGTEDKLKNFILSSFLAFAGRAPEIIVDGLLGTGFNKTLRPDMAILIKAINALAVEFNARVLAIDIPSGLNGLTGKPAPICIKATATLTLAAAKSGLVMAREWTGELYARGISLPQAINAACPSMLKLLDGRLLLAEQQHWRDNSYKNVFGHVYVFGGSAGYSGAAYLASLAVLRRGAGLVTACAPFAAVNQIKGGMAEIMTLAVTPAEQWPKALSPEIQTAASAASCLVAGPGMGRAEDAAAFLGALLAIPDRSPAIVDADALILISRQPELLKLLNSTDIITPHPGEAAALLGVGTAEIQNDRFAALRELTNLSDAVAVLKGAGTLIGQKNETALLCPYDIPQLAIGGAGDVLSGCLAALRGLYPQVSTLEIAARGVLEHALAGLAVAQKFPWRGALASDIADALPHVHSFVESLDRARLEKGALPWPQFY